MKVTSKRRYSIEFKRAAVQKSIDSPFTVQSIAEELNIHPKMLSRWRREMTKTSRNNNSTAVKNTGPTKSYDDLARENKELKKKLERAELEADILKKAKEYFDKKLK